MKKIRIFAWLLVVAMLAMLCPAFGEDVSLDIDDGAVQEEEVFASPDASASEELTDIETGDDLDLEVPDIEVPEIAFEEEEQTAADATGADFEANSEAVESLSAQYRSKGGADNDELFAGYVDMLFGKLPQRNGYVGDTLTGVSKKVFDYLLQEIKKIAAGTRSSTMIDIPTSVIPESQWEEAFYALDDVIDVLLADCPYHLFWYHKVYGTSYGVDPDGRGLYCDFTVAEEYAKSEYETDTAKIKSAQVAVTNAKKVVSQYAGVSDYKKLRGYRDYICGATDYNDNAVDVLQYDEFYYGNPWQLIWVFDDDPSTKVVCEGYSKAFQYLCDLSSFNGGIQAYTVTGIGGDSSGYGGHMWNIVRMEDGKYYHVDVTFCDSGLPEDFLVGTAQAAQNGEYFYVLNRVVYYKFDEDTLHNFPKKVLTLSTKDYDPAQAPEIVQPKGISITKGKSATLYMGNELTLKAKLKPSNASTKLTWKSSDKAVATVEAIKDNKAIVRPIKAGTAVITVKTANKKSAKITIKVVDAKSIKIKKGSNTLSSKKTYSMKKGRVWKLKAVVSPSKVKPTLTWTSSNENVATVSDAGEVKALKKGTVYISVKTANKKTAKIKIKVK